MSKKPFIGVILDKGDSMDDRALEQSSISGVFVDADARDAVACRKYALTMGVLLDAVPTPEELYAHIADEPPDLFFFSL